MSQKILSDEQKAIINWIKSGSGNLVVKSRAGVGKSFTIIEGLNHAPENSILLACFNKDIQLEAASKITSPKVQASTFHSVGFSYLKSIWPRCRADKFTEMERVKIVCPEFPEEMVFIVTKLISYLKNLYINPTLENAKEIQDVRGLEIYGENKKWNDKIPQIALDAIELSKIPRNNKISFDDMLFLPLALNLIKPKYQFSILEESQDCNLPQFEMIRQATFPNGRICLVGDDRQQIYSWRGAMHNGMEIYKQKLNAQELTLTKTFRCPKAVVRLAQTLVPDYTFDESAPEGEVIDMEYKKAIESLKIGNVLLSRTNFPMVPICLKLIRRKVSCYIKGRDTVKQLIAIVKDVDALDAFDFGNKIQNWHDTRISLAKGKSADKKIDLIKEQAETLKEIATEVIKSNKNSVQDIIDVINSIFYDTDFVKKPSVILSSIHRFKGKENATIFILNDTLNLSHPKQTASEKHEELNLCYTAWTRTKEKLVRVNGLGKD